MTNSVIFVAVEATQLQLDKIPPSQKDTYQKVISTFILDPIFLSVL